MMKRFGLAGCAALCAFTVYVLTAFPTITWWDSAGYSTAAATLGVMSAPGSLLLTLLGWPVAHLPLGSSPAHRLNLFAGLLATVATVLVYIAAKIAMGDDARIATHDRRDWIGLKFGAAIGALTFAFASTTWEYAIMFTPYILTAVFTAAILCTLLHWWHRADREDSWIQLALLGLLFGLDFSVHRTNALLVPGAAAFILIRRPRAIVAPRNVLSAIVGLFAGLSVQLLLIPIARLTNSELNFGNPRDFTRFMEYVTLSQSGGNFFVKLFPRNADVWNVQVADFLRALGDNIFHWRGATGVAGVLPAVAAILGLIAIARRHGRLAVALLVLLLLQAFMTVLCFNIPANYFRSLDRHYLPVFTTIGVLVACGMAACGHWFGTQLQSRKMVAILLAMLMVSVPAVQLIDNWQTHNASHRYFARDYAENALKALPPNAIFFTVGDNDTYPLMYLQFAEHVRPDVQIVNMSVAQYNDYPDQRHEHAPDFPIKILSAERKVLASKPWTDTVAVIPWIENSASFVSLSEALQSNDSVFIVKPSFDTTMTVGEITFLDIIKTNAWRRPITISATATRSGALWLEPYARRKGMYWQIVPFRNPKADVESIRRSLLSENRYRGYADTSIAVDDVSSIFGALYYDALSELAAVDRANGDTVSCKAAVDRMRALMPPERLKMRNDFNGVSVPKCE